MNIVDVIVVLGVSAAVISGERAGLVGMIAGALGTIGGLVIGALFARDISEALGIEGRGQVLVMSFVVVLAVAVVSYLAQLVAIPVAASIRAVQLGWVDRVAGGAIAFVLGVGLAWLLGGVLAVAPSQSVARAVQDSVFLRMLDDRLPPAPGVVADIQQALIDRGMPLPFAGFEPQLDPVDPPSTEVVAAAQAAAAPSTVRITALGCGGGMTGSGVVLAPQTVFTNAHVVAGAEMIEVEAVDGRHRADVVFFDPKTDLAVLRVDQLDVPVLPLATDDVPIGSGAAVLGYPGGGPLVVTPAAVLDRQSAVGFDITGSGTARRDVYVLQAYVRAGDSGGPFVDVHGTVLGLVFARSNVNGNVGYALTGDELAPALAAVGAMGGPVGTGSCVG